LRGNKNLKSPRLRYALYWAVIPILLQFLVDAKDQYVLHHFIHPLAVAGALWPELLVAPVVTFALVYVLYPYRAAIEAYTSKPRAGVIEEVEISPDARERTPPAG